MKPFLSQVAALFYSQYGPAISSLAFVFPNRRAGLFFQKYLSEIASQPVFSPKVLMINDLFVQLSGLHLADRISMLFKLYEIYVRQSGATETFDEFLYWGEMLLNDFDNVDKYMADARMLFHNVTDLKEIEDDFSFLTEEQIAAIRTFWSSFYPKGDTPNQREFVAVWEILYAIYTELKESLRLQRKGYEGMIFREVAEKAEKQELPPIPYAKVIFVGFNALSVAEEKFMKILQQQSIADFYWDYTSPLVIDKDNRASYFVEKNVKQFPSRYPLEVEKRASSPQIDVIGVPSGIGQAKHLYNLLNQINAQKEVSDEESLRTAVVLPDESLLIPVLNSIPDTIRHINVTMGYPLSGTPVAGLMEYILAMQKNVRYVDGKAAFYHRDVLPVLNHRYVMTTDPIPIGALIKEIVGYNKIYIAASDLGRTPLLSILFTAAQEKDDFSDYLIRVLQEFNKTMTTSSGDDDDPISKRMHDVEQEFIFHYFTTVNRMKEVMADAGIQIKIETYFRLLKRMTDTITIPFLGEPLSGLQVMGVLETRALDFDRLIVLSVNEGVFPAKKNDNSFIPYNLRKGFGLPTYEHQDSIWAYHFYRLIHRAKQVILLYDTRSNGAHTGEISRFVYQLRYHYNLSLRDQLLVYNVSSLRVPAIIVEKNQKIQNRLENFHARGKRAFSASAINTYLDCPLKFYFSAVEGIQEEEEVSETVENNVFGSILHRVLENLYAPFKGKLVTADLLQNIRKDTSYINHIIENAFAELFFKTEKVRALTGQNFLIGEMIRKYVRQLLVQDAHLTPFTYIDSEKRMSAALTLSDGRLIRLKGFIDRIDEVGGRRRIIDYKSGRGLSVFDSVDRLFDRTTKERAKAVMQVFLYSWMLGQQDAGRPVVPAIYYMRSLFSENFDSNIYMRPARGKREVVADFGLYKESFETALCHCIEEIFDTEIPFVQTEQEEICTFCSFKSICGR